MHFTLTDLITDITQNGVESGASVVELQVGEIRDSSGKESGPAAGSGGGELRFTVIDNGKGMTEEELKRAQDPFVTDGIKHPHRKVGLGLPFLIQTAEASGGGWKMESKKAGSGVESGTKVCAWFDLGNVDTPPVGDVPGMFRTVLLFGGPEEMVIKRLLKSPEGELDYEVRKTELLGALGDLEDTQSLILLDRYLRSLEEAGE
jgi:hypothetical protein